MPCDLSAPVILVLHPSYLPQPAWGEMHSHAHKPAARLSFLPHQIWLVKSRLLYPFCATRTILISFNSIRPQVMCRCDSQDSCYDTSDSILVVKSNFSFHKVLQPRIRSKPLPYGESKFLSCHQFEPVVPAHSSHFHSCFCSWKQVLIFLLSVVQLSLLEYTSTSI